LSAYKYVSCIIRNKAYFGDLRCVMINIWLWYG